MEIDGFWIIAGAGSLGGVLVEGTRLSRRLQQGRPPKHWWYYVLGTVLLVLIAGLFAGIHTGHVNTLLVAAQLGAAAPALIGAWASGQPNQKVIGIAPRFESWSDKLRDAVGW